MTGLDRAKPSPDDLVSTRQAAEMLGRTKATIRKWVRRGQLVPWRVGSQQEPTLFLKEDVYECATERVKATPIPRVLDQSN